MSGRVQGKVALVTGAGRGQGRSHAIRLAEEGADIVAIDFCGSISTVPYDMSKAEDLAETVRQVEALDSRCVAREADVRQFPAFKEAVDEAVAELGGLDIVCGNAGIASAGPADLLSEEEWQDVIDVNLTGVWHTAKAAIPHLRATGRGGSIVLTSSIAAIQVPANIAHYGAAKAGVVGLMRALAVELGAESIRVNAVLPTQVNTQMIMNDAFMKLFVPGKENPTVDDFAPVSQAMHLLPVPWVEPVDISNAVLFLASDEARFITGSTLAVDCGALAK